MLMLNMCSGYPISYYRDYGIIILQISISGNRFVKLLTLYNLVLIYAQVLAIHLMGCSLSGYPLILTIQYAVGTAHISLHALTLLK